MPLVFKDLVQHFNNSRTNKTTNLKDHKELNYRIRLTKGKTCLRPLVLAKDLVSKFKLKLLDKHSDMLQANKNQLAQALATIWVLVSNR